MVILSASNRVESRYIYIYIVVALIISSFLANIFLNTNNNTFATGQSSNVNYSVTVEPSLNVTISGDNDGVVALDLNPLSQQFVAKDLNITISTNNADGYYLVITADDTDLVEKSDDSLIIETLEDNGNTGYTESTFMANRWGYKINSNVISNANYFPFRPYTIISHNNISTNGDTARMTFAAKADLDTTPGSYELDISFQAVPNINPWYIQDFDNNTCRLLASWASFTVIDARDGKDYQVRYINGNCWMVQNLRYIGDAGSTSGTMIIKSATTNIEADKNISYTDLTSGNSVGAAKIHNSGNTSDGVWYNYAAASAMTITGSSNNDALSQDLCPRNWKIAEPSEFETVVPYQSAFFNDGDPVTSGIYYYGVIERVGRGYWLSSSPQNSSNRYTLTYGDGSLWSTGYIARFGGAYVRCVLK